MSLMFSVISWLLFRLLRLIMFGKAVFCLSTLHFYGEMGSDMWTMAKDLICWMWGCISGVAAQGDCVDLRGRSVSNGMHYVPGPDTCTLCVCEMGQPKVCKAVLCSPPQVSYTHLSLALGLPEWNLEPRVNCWTGSLINKMPANQSPSLSTNLI